MQHQSYDPVFDPCCDSSGDPSCEPSCEPPCDHPSVCTSCEQPASAPSPARYHHARASLRCVQAADADASSALSEQLASAAAREAELSSALAEARASLASVQRAHTLTQNQLFEVQSRVDEERAAAHEQLEQTRWEVWKGNEKCGAGMWCRAAWSRSARRRTSSWSRPGGRCGVDAGSVCGGRVVRLVAELEGAQRSVAALEVEKASLLEKLSAARATTAAAGDSAGGLPGYAGVGGSGGGGG
eukprot:306665-Chlamydomonas_euryale.AAC.1